MEGSSNALSLKQDVGIAWLIRWAVASFDTVARALVSVYACVTTYVQPGVDIHKYEDDFSCFAVLRH